MPELRKDPVIGRWVIIATERSRRPDHFRDSSRVNGEDPVCPFCEGNESQTPPEIYAIRKDRSQANKPGWELRVIPSIAPFLRVEGEADRQGKGLYDLMSGIGAHEVVVETNQHIANMADLSREQIDRVLASYVNRITDLEKDQRFKYVLVFKNYGQPAAGGKHKHARSQLIATPVNPKRVKEELVGARQYYDIHERCVFCDIIRQELVSQERVVLDIDGFVAITPFASRFPFEVWILPKKHSPDFISIGEQQRGHLAELLKRVLMKFKVGLNDPPYSYIIHSAPFRHMTAPGYWKTIDYDYHWHIEIMPRLTRVAGFEWGTGFYICPVKPEETATFLREIKE